MYVWIIGRDFPQKENNMLGSFEFEQAKMLAMRGYSVFYPVIDLRSIRHRRRIGLVHKTICGVNIVTLNIPIGRALPRIVRNKLYDPLRRHQFKLLKKKYGTPDIINIHYPATYGYDIFAEIQANGAKIIGTEHWSKVQNFELTKKEKENLKTFVIKANAIVCVERKLRDAIVEITRTKRRIIIIPNSVPPIFNYRDQEYEKNIFRFLAVGRLSKEKGYDKLIEAFCKCFKINPRIQLDIIGGGEEIDKLKRIIIQNKAENVVFLHGVMRRDELTYFYTRSNVLVMPSDYETFGIPVVEAMSCGLPVIVTKNVGVSHYIDKKRGLVIENNETGNLANALTEIYHRYIAFNRKDISDFSDKTFSEDVVFEMIKEVFDRVVKGEMI